MRSATGLLAGLACFAAALPASAVLQPTPGGIPIPVLDTSVVLCKDKNAQPCLDIGEGKAGLISAQNDALIAPQTFQPTCALTFTPINKGGADPIAFGWYNVKPDPANAGNTLKPANNELYPMMFFPPGFKSNADLASVAPKALDLASERAAGHYKDGQVAFWLAGGNNLAADPVTGTLTGDIWHVFYTEHAFNPGSSASQTYYQVLTWQSVVHDKSFYFGWEDLPASSSSDNDFDDLIFLVSGIQCNGGGQPCTVPGAKGVCAEGTMQCQKGVLTCTPNQVASAEKCNALDDDCNGIVDDGDLCGSQKVCDRGVCVPRCGVGEFRCQGGETCTAKGLCVETACASKDCPPGQICSGGNCLDACQGVKCPYGQTCRNGGCVDLCAQIQCDQGYTCVDGVCQSCSCSTCDTGLVCKDNVCVDSTCASVSCNTGTHCVAGKCVDNCGGVKCPRGQACSKGACVATGDAVGGANGAGGDSSLGGGLVLGNGGIGHGGVEDRASGKDAGCACRTSNRDAASSGALLLSLLAAAAAFRRRRTAS